jgi:hypothetical protein
VVAGIANAPLASNPDTQWHDFMGASVSLSLASASAVALSWNLTVPTGGVIFVRVAVDGVGLPGTSGILLSTGTVSGAYHVNLSGVPHVVSLQYKTSTAFNFDPTIEFEAAGIEAMVFDQ